MGDERPRPQRLVPLLELEFADPAEALGRALAASEHAGGLAAWERAVGLHHELLSASGTVRPAATSAVGPLALHERRTISSEELDAHLFLHLVAVPTAGAPVDRAAVEWLGHCVEAAVLGGWRADRLRPLASLFCDLAAALERTWALDPALAAVDVGDDAPAHNRRILERALGRLPRPRLRTTDERQLAVLNARPDALWWRGRHPEAEQLADLGFQAVAAGVAAPVVGVMQRGPDVLSVSPIVLDVEESVDEHLEGTDRVSGTRVRLRVGDPEPEPDAAED
ncbi:MAG: hypothetical protein AAFZ07_14735 [Actinomycetota bacterium]